MFLVINDSHLYVSFQVNSSEDLDRILARIKLCILDIKIFIIITQTVSESYGKREVVVLSSPANSHGFGLSEVLVGSCTIRALLLNSMVLIYFPF